MNPLFCFASISQSLLSREGLSREDIPDVKLDTTQVKRMLYGNGVTWEIIITVPYSQDIVNVEHLIIALLSIFHYL